MKKIIVIGDSHSTFWRGQNKIYTESSVFSGLDICHLDAATAYNIFNQEENSKFIKKITETLSDSSKYGAAIFCFGEIDCRVHIVRAALRGGVSINLAVEETVSRYMRFVDWFIKKFSIPVIIWGPGPTTSPARPNFNPEYPTVGTVIERNYASYIFNCTLAREAELRVGVAHASVFEFLVDISGNTRPQALFDGCHVDIAIMEEALKALRVALSRLGASELIGNLARRWLIQDKPRLCNIAEGLKAEPNVRLDNYAPRNFTHNPNGEACFRAAADNKPPRAIIDLKSAYILSEIHIFSINADKIESLRFLSVAAGLRPSKMHLVYKAKNIVPDNIKNGIIIRVSENMPPSRFVFLFLEKGSVLEIDTVRVLAQSFDITMQNK